VLPELIEIVPVVKSPIKVVSILVVSFKDQLLVFIELPTEAFFLVLVPISNIRPTIGVSHCSVALSNSIFCVPNVNVCVSVFNSSVDCFSHFSSEGRLILVTSCLEFDINVVLFGEILLLQRALVLLIDVKISLRWLKFYVTFWFAMWQRDEVL
jgi:hypothetical protein